MSGLFLVNYFLCIVTHSGVYDGQPTHAHLWSPEALPRSPFLSSIQARSVLAAEHTERMLLIPQFISQLAPETISSVWDTKLLVSNISLSK